MGFLLLTVLVFWAMQFGVCHCRRTIFRFIPPCLVLGIFLWIEAGYQPGPGCGVRMAFEIALIGACVVGIALGWIAYGIEEALRMRG